MCGGVGETEVGGSVFLKCMKLGHSVLRTHFLFSHKRTANTIRIGTDMSKQIVNSCMNIIIVVFRVSLSHFIGIIAKEIAKISLYITVLSAHLFPNFICIKTKVSLSKLSKLCKPVLFYSAVCSLPK